MSAHILIAEDEENMAAMLEYRIQKAGYTVSVVSDGLQAVQSITSDRPDVSLLDIGLPVLDGMNVLHQIRNEASTRHLKVVMLSGHDEQAHIDRALDAGADRYLVKPIDPALLISCIEDLLSAKTTLPYDLATLENWFASDLSSMRSHVERFIDTSEKRMTALRNAIATDDRSEAAERAHQLLGALANLGAADTVRAAKALEHDLRTTNELSLEELERELQVLVAGLQNWLIHHGLEENTP